MKNDIEQRAKKAIEKVKEYSKGKGLSFNEEVNRYGGYIVGFKEAMTEERESGKRFNHWTRINGYEYSTIFEYFANDNDYEKRWTYEQLFDQFLSEERGNKVLEELIQTIERNAIDNKSTISDVKLWAKSWRKEKALNN